MSKRRTNAEMEALFDHVVEILDGYDGDRISIRHLCYRLASIEIIPKTEAAFSLVGKHLAKWRFEGRIPFGAFVDSTRWHYGATTFDDLEEALTITVETYRKNLWREQTNLVEIWVEKEAVAGIVSPVSNSWGIRTFVCRGFASITSTWEAAETFKEAIEAGKDPVILYLGDHDESGHKIDRAIFEKHFGHYGVRDNVDFRRVAVLPEQIEELKLPTRPSKGDSDFGDCVEIDTLSSEQIRTLLEDEIAALINPREWNQLQTVEAEERATAAKILAAYQRKRRRND
jgi:hypothetical protein